MKKEFFHRHCVSDGEIALEKVTDEIYLFPEANTLLHPGGLCRA